MVADELSEDQQVPEDKKAKSTRKRKLSTRSDSGRKDKIVKPDESQTEGEKEDVEKRAKRHKKRKRHYFNAIRAQMEFYFGDANLSKDRYLKKLITQDPYVPLDVFMTFNKMKTLAKSVDEIAKSLSNSQLLELDESNLKVRRKTLPPEERNVDEKTLYVESLPATATHDWVRQIFERFGVVTYVSLPKYAKSRKIKEFGFVEFENESSVDKAVSAFKNFNGVLKTEDTDPAELTSVKSFINEQNEATNETQENTVKLKTEDDKKRKRKKCKSSNRELDPLAKRIKQEDQCKHEEEEEEDIETTTNTQSSEVSDNDDTEKQNIKEENVEDGLKAALNETNMEISAKKTKKKRKNIKDPTMEADLVAEAAYFELKILPKRDWKRLRNKYLNLQRQKIGELKRKAFRERQEQLQQQQQQTMGTKDDDFDENDTKKCKSKLNAGMNMNFYGAGDDETALKSAKKNPALERAPLFHYEPGLIVEVLLSEPCTNLKEFKTNMRQYVAVKYVDIKEGSKLANLRLESPTAAEQFVQRMNGADYGCKLLTGEAEKSYWQKIEKDREAKLNKQVKLPQKRGREKIKKLITQHIRFGDEEL